VVGDSPGRVPPIRPVSLGGNPATARAVPPVIPPLVSAAVREFEFTEADFDRVRRLIHRQAGISLSAAKQDMVYSRLARRLRATGAKTFNAYLDRLEKGDRAEWEHFINSLTTNLTSFFREPHHFPILAEHLKKRVGQHPLRVWCCAASTGEEPYSIAMTLAEALPAGQSAQIVASDIDTGVLATAGAGIYAPDRVERMDPDRLRRFFDKSPGGDRFTAKAELRRMIAFQRLNLLDPSWSVRGPFDVIFCRNVMIYFDKPTQHVILKRFAPLLQPDGLLIAGHSESFLHAADVFRSIGKTVYVRA
jgi:chemotaxis protein methyltransferase CheR